MLKNNVIVVAFNARLTDGCDYALQTMRILSFTNRVYAFLLGEPRTWKDVLGWSARHIVEHKENITLIHPFFLVPGQRRARVRSVNYFFNAFIFRIVLFCLYPGLSKLLWIFEPINTVPVMTGFFGTQTVYDCVDYNRDPFMGMKQAENYILRTATFVVCNSKTLLKKLRLIRKDVHLVPLGFSQQLFPQNVVRNKADFVIGYVGGINWRLNYPLLISVIGGLPNITFVFAGPIEIGIVPFEKDTKRHVQELFRLHNVKYLGNIPKNMIAQTMAAFDIGIIPYHVRYGFNRYSFPMKVMEYMWLEIPVIASDISELKNYPDAIKIAHTKEEWLRVIRRIQHDGWIDEECTKQRNFVKAHTWQKKIEAISELLAR